MEFAPGEGAQGQGQGQGFSSSRHLELELFMSSKDNMVSSSGCGGGGEAAAEREQMFEKVVTPSDVGKLNRLVIPKQHAEKYFPLDPTNSDKGLFLNFQDSSGKPWRFRYSYWTSSQSYVMTKGWSRFVKDKHLDAGDTVSFLRDKLDSSSLFIDWRRSPSLHHHFSPSSSFHRLSSAPWTPLLLPQPTPHHYLTTHLPNYDVFVNHPHYHQNLQNGHNSNNMASSSRRWIGINPSMVLDSVPVVQGKKLRLFGVNMETDISSDDPTSYGRSLQLQPNNDKEGKPSSNSHSDMSLDFHM